MSKFENYLTEEEQTHQDLASLLEIVVFMEEYKQLKEGKIQDLGKVIKNVLPSLGLKVTKHDSLLGLLAKSFNHLSDIFYHSFLAYYDNDENHKAKAKELLKKVKKSDILDFLIRLDHITLHAISGPIHMIDAITGWHISADVDKLGKQVSHKVKQAIDSLDDLAQSVATDTKKTIARYSNALRRLFDVGKFVKVGRDV